MKRLLLCLGILACISPAWACGNASKGTSVTVRVGPEYFFESTDNRIQVFDLAPSGNPYGTIAIKLVENGRVKILQSQRFDGMQRAGSLVLTHSHHELAVGYDTQGGVGFYGGAPIALPRFGGYGQGESQAAFDTVASGSEMIVWMTSFNLRKDSGGADPSINHGFAAFVAQTKRNPTQEFYCLTITVDPKAQPAN